MLDIEEGRDGAAGADLVRRLLPLMLEEGPLDGAVDRGPHTAVVVDTETTGFSRTDACVVELAMRRFRFTDDGTITHLGRTFGWLQDPGKPLSSETVRLTKLTDEMVRGQSIDVATATTVLRSASLVIAHNASFDRWWVEQLLPDAAGLPWACSMTEIDWRELGYDSRVLGYLLCQAGYYHHGHRAGADVDAVIQLLRQRDADGRTHLSRLLETSSRPSWIVRAIGAAFSSKDALKDRGYRWDADHQCWWREIQDKDRMAEEWWLSANVYGPDHRPKALGPEFVSVSAMSRFS